MFSNPEVRKKQMSKCKVCKETRFSGGGKTLFRAPKDQKRREKWSEICGVNFAKNSRICSDHFLPSRIIHPGSNAILMPNSDPFIQHFQEVNTLSNRINVPIPEETTQHEAETLISNNKIDVPNLTGTVVWNDPHVKSGKFFTWEQLTTTANAKKELNKKYEVQTEMPDKNQMLVSSSYIMNQPLTNKNNRIEFPAGYAIDQQLIRRGTITRVNSNQHYEKTSYSFCALSCPYPKNLYAFPSRKNDEKRRKLWLNYFNMDEPSTDGVYACERHFSRSQKTSTGLRKDAVPDVPPLYDTIHPPFKKKFRKTRLGVKCDEVLPTDPLNFERSVDDCELSVDVLGENLVNINNNVQQGNSLLQMSFVKAEARTISTQTNTRLCGTVQVSEFAQDYRFNCFYCCQTFPLVKWKKFITHLERKHCDYEEAFENYKYVSDDHDYTPINVKNSTTLETAPVTKLSQLETLLIDPKSILPHLVDPLESSYTLSVNSLDRHSNTDILNDFVKPEMPSFVVDPIADEENIFNVSANISKLGTATTSLPKGTKNEKKKSTKNKMSSKSSLENTGKSKQKVLTSGVFYLKNLKNIKRQTSTKTALSRCLKRSNTIETLDAVEIGDQSKFSAAESFEQKATELTFEYTPRDIIDSLIDNIKNFPVLWQFDDTTFNEDFYEAIEELCRIINEKWSLNIDTLKMRRSVNRVLRFYCSLYPCENLENVNQFTYYYDKCALFLPDSVHDIAYARCSHCYKCYQNDFELKAHLLDEQKYLQWPYKCVDCKECFRDNDEYEFHKRLPHYQEVFRCQLCKKRFTRRNKYNRHVLTHKLKQSDEPGKYVCNVCGKDYKVSGELRNHLIYHGEKKHKCHLCPKKYFSNALLVKHIEAHNKEYRLMCEICGKGFINHNNLREHMNKHTGVKVTCNICNLKLRKSSLSRHLRLVHVACEGTIESTYRARNHHFRRLLLHPSKKTNHNRPSKYKNYSCKICNIKFESYKSLIIHNKELHFDAPKWSCELCSSESKNKINIKRHYRIKHGFHAYQVYKLIEKKEDINTVLAIKKEELDKLSETLSYSLAPGPAKNPEMKPTIIIKTDPSEDEISIEEERLNCDTIQDEIMNVADNMNTSEHEIKIDDDNYMNDFFTNLLK